MLLYEQIGITGRDSRIPRLKIQRVKIFTFFHLSRKYTQNTTKLGLYFANVSSSSFSLLQFSPHLERSHPYSMPARPQLQNIICLRSCLPRLAKLKKKNPCNISQGSSTSLLSLGTCWSLCHSCGFLLGQHSSLSFPYTDTYAFPQYIKINQSSATRMKF